MGLYIDFSQGYSWITILSLAIASIGALIIWARADKKFRMKKVRIIDRQLARLNQNIQSLNK